MDDHKIYIAYIYIEHVLTLARMANGSHILGDGGQFIFTGIYVAMMFGFP